MREGTTFGDARERCLAGLDERDRRFAYALAAGVLRRQAGLDHTLELRRADRRLHDILRLGMYQLRHMRVPPHAAVSTSVDLAREAAGEGGARYVNRRLRAIATAPAANGTPASHPRWLAARWRRRFGAEEAERLIAWNDTPPAVTLQSARWDLETLHARLVDVGVPNSAAPFDVGIQIRAGAPARLPGYEAGGFIVQDAAHALVSRFAAIPSGTVVYDACAAPGGKTVTLERLGAHVVAGDLRPERLGHLAATAKRVGVAPRMVVADLLAAPFAAGSLAAVLVDAPCTATGTMARHPDARWRVTPAALARAAIRQTALLGAAATLIRPGGLLVYATCSLEAEEDEDVVNAFLERHTDFHRAPPASAVPSTLLTAEGDFRSLPQRHAIDGAYAARLQRDG